MRRGRTAPVHRARPARLAIACVAIALSTGFGARLARAETPPAPERRLFLRLGLGPAFSYESYRPQAPVPGGSYFGFGPALDVAVGWRIVPGLVVGGALQSAGILNRDERYLGHSYPLSESLHLVDTAGRARGLHVPLASARPRRGHAGCAGDHRRRHRHGRRPDRVGPCDVRARRVPAAPPRAVGDRRPRPAHVLPSRCEHAGAGVGRDRCFADVVPDVHARLTPGQTAKACSDMRLSYCVRPIPDASH